MTSNGETLSVGWSFRKHYVVAAAMTVFRLTIVFSLVLGAQAQMAMAMVTKRRRADSDYRQSLPFLFIQLN